MEIQVVSFLDKIIEDNCMFEDKTYYLNVGCRRVYYKMQQKKVEVLYLNEIELLKTKVKKRGEKLILIMKEINNENENEIYDFIKGKASIVLVGRNNSKNKMLKNIVLLEEIDKGELMSLDVLLRLLSNEEIFTELRLIDGKTKIIIGEGEEDSIVSKIVISTLSKINDIKDGEMLDIYILGEVGLNMQVIADIEDPIRDYLPNSKLRIKQRENDKQDKNIKYLIKYNK